MLYNIVPKYYGLFRHQHYHPGVGEIIGIEIGTKKASPPPTLSYQNLSISKVYICIYIYIYVTIFTAIITTFTIIL